MNLLFVRFLNVLLLGTTSFAASAAGNGCDFGEPNPDAPPQFSQYAFLVGNFDINIQVWQDGQWFESGQTAKWDGRYDLDGLAIVDVWTDYGYPERPDSGIGINVRMWDADQKVWKMMWQHTGRNEVRDLRSQLRGEGRLVLWQVYPMAPERKIYFENYDQGSWARIEEKVDETTEKWVPSVRLLATPRPCADG